MYTIKTKHLKKTLVLVIIFVLSGCSGTSHNSGNKGFEAFTKHLFQQEVSANSISLHYTLKDPEQYGVLDAPITLGSFQSNELLAKASIENCKAALSNYSYNTLSKDNKITYDILDTYLNTALEGTDYAFYDEPLSPLTGIQSQLPILLSEYPFYSSKDVDTYLELLGSTGAYFDSLITFQKDKAAQGLFMAPEQVDNIINECTTFIEMGNSNYLYATFVSRIDTLKELTDTQKEGYISQNNELLLSTVFPAYQTLSYELGLLRNAGKNNAGLCYLPLGKDYYEHIVKRDVGTSKGITQLQKMTKKQIVEDLQAMESLLKKGGNESGNSTDFSSLTAQRSVEILEELQTSIDKNFPTAPDVSLNVKYVPQVVEDYVSPAFYMIPAIDNISSNTIYINKKRTVDGLQLFTTLAHEGYPGHLYQTTYYAATKPDPLRSILSFGGYVEGWATYAEMCSYYLSPLSQNQATLYQKNASVILGLYALADMGIHYDGWTVADTSAFFEIYGIADSDTIKDIYQLIVGDPGNYLKYYIGYVEFLNLKKEALVKWGDSFTQKKFHKTILELGPAPFDIVEKYIIQN